ncbi:putative NAD dependent epimerase dehydratase family protein [Rosellinia necatrix]|uniref:Putative NAD dependent epimerase dehydratase family protein n=1 Tax=Rosellinia necatrix TaxID=77044 RepID=A0A1W2TBP3_ROSNE|nr:putative NAD dependent epimerase dehydratase family protein [Rosellinia necatrix]
MSHNILITGGSGYLGGTLLARWSEAKLPPYNKLFALVRTPQQAEAVKKYGAEPLAFDAYNEKEVWAAVVDNNITIVYHLIAPRPHVSQSYFIKAMAEVKRNTGLDVHFLHTTGAKIFSSHAGAPTDAPLLDSDPGLYEIQKAQIAENPMMQEAVDANNFVIEEAEKYGVRSYVFAPCIVYGEGEGFSNRISIQTVAIVRAAEAVKRMYRTDTGRPTWPVCHVLDNTNVYLELMRKILVGANPSYGPNGYYLASPGSVAWDDIYAAMATALAKRNIITDDTVVLADDTALEAMGKALGCPASRVPVMVGGKCTFTADRGPKELGWKPLYGPEHILEYADTEVDFILRNKNW